jgi:hypothetical protein
MIAYAGHSGAQFICIGGCGGKNIYMLNFYLFFVLV